MQFLANLTVVCPECHGARFQREVLDAKLRGLSIAEVLNLSADEAFAFFRGQPQLQRRLKSLKDVGLGYLPLGQSASTLSRGECQRLKLATFLARRSRKRTLFLMDEPCIGLHARHRGFVRVLSTFDRSRPLADRDRASPRVHSRCRLGDRTRPRSWRCGGPNRGGFWKCGVSAPLWIIWIEGFNAVLTHRTPKSERHP